MESLRNPRRSANKFRESSGYLSEAVDKTARLGKMQLLSIEGRGEKLCSNFSSSLI